MRSNYYLLAIIWVFTVIALSVYFLTEPLVGESVTAQYALLLAIVIPIGGVIFAIFSYINTKLIELTEDKNTIVEGTAQADADTFSSINAEHLAKKFENDFKRTPTFLVISSITWILGIVCWIIYFQWEGDPFYSYYANWIVIPAICFPLFVPFYGGMLLYQRIRRQLRAKKERALHELKYSRGLRNTYK